MTEAPIPVLGGDQRHCLGKGHHRQTRPAEVGLNLQYGGVENTELSVGHVLRRLELDNVANIDLCQCPLLRIQKTCSRILN